VPRAVTELLFEDAQAAMREALACAPKGRKLERLAAQKAATTAELSREVALQRARRCIQ
jgi:hypothetical protein